MPATIDDMKQLIRSLLLMAAYVVAARLAFSAASLFWHPPAGVRFAFFLLLPPALWLPLILMDQLVDWALDPSQWMLNFRGWWWFLAFFLASAGGPWLLHKARFKRIEGLTSMAWLLGAMLLTALLRSAVNLAWPVVLLIEAPPFLPGALEMFTGYGGWMAAITLARILGLMSGPWWLRRTGHPLVPDDANAMQNLLLAIAASALCNATANIWRTLEREAAQPTLDRFLQIALGDINGTLMLVPLGLLMLRARPDASMVRRWARDIPLVLLPALLLYAAAVQAIGTRVHVFATALCALPVLYFAQRTGWRGVAIALPLANIAMAVASIRSGNTEAAIQVQLFLAVVGIAALLLGSSVDELNRRNLSLAASNARLDQLTDELRSAARRNLAMSEDLRRHLASELHDELGQNLTALQTRIKLAERKVDDPEVFAPLRDLMNHMRHVVSGLMNSLRPAGLDAFGLARALQQGSIRGLVEASGMAYRLRIEDDGNLLRRLDDDTQTAIYRIVQEAATNAVRHAEARHLDVHLRARPGADCMRIGLCITDDGRGIDPDSPRLRAGGLGLQGIRDRVLLLGGQLRIRSDAGGTRLVVRFTTCYPKVFGQ